MTNRILMQHPQGKKGVNIKKDKYETVKAAILETLEGRSLTHAELITNVSEKLKEIFDSSIGRSAIRWYTESVKLDLEARRLIERDTSLNPNRYQLSRFA